MLMIATVRAVQPETLLVFDRATRQDVLVHTRSTRCFREGDRVSILYNGVMTRSLPPQITAVYIRRLNPRCDCR